MDHLAPHERSENMSRIRSGDTSPEMIVRQICWNLGYRYRLHVKDLPGKPDLVFRPLRKVIFASAVSGICTAAAAAATFQSLADCIDFRNWKGTKDATPLTKAA